MHDSNSEVTRREFLLSSALISASSAVGYTSPILNELIGQDTSAVATMPTVEVNMARVFPSGGVYFRKSNPQ